MELRRSVWPHGVNCLHGFLCKHCWEKEELKAEIKRLRTRSKQMKTEWNRVYFEPELGRKYLVWWSTKQKGRFAIGEYRWDIDELAYVWTANGSREYGKLVEFWSELPDAPSEQE
jgi:hypothetical protein